jgi:hypothetical protein
MEKCLSLKSSKCRKSRSHGLLFSTHWCMLHAFWSISELHPPKMGTFSGSHSNAAYRRPSSSSCGAHSERRLTRKQKMRMIYIVTAIPRRAPSTPCKQGNKQHVVLVNLSVKARQQEDACKFNQSSNNCVPIVRFNCVRNCVLRYNHAPFSSNIEQQPF